METECVLSLSRSALEARKKRKEEEREKIGKASEAKKRKRKRGANEAKESGNDFSKNLFLFFLFTENNNKNLQALFITPVISPNRLYACTRSTLTVTVLPCRSSPSPSKKTSLLCLDLPKAEPPTSVAPVL